MTDFPYTVIVKADPNGGFWTQVPALPGCGSQGDTLDEALEMTAEAIDAYVASMLKHGETPPRREGWSRATVGSEGGDD